MLLWGDQSQPLFLSLNLIMRLREKKRGSSAWHNLREIRRSTGPTTAFNEFQGKGGSVVNMLLIYESAGQEPRHVTIWQLPNAIPTSVSFHHLSVYQFHIKCSFGTDSFISAKSAISSNCLFSLSFH